MSPPRPGSAKPRGAAPEWRADLRPARHRATSHNGVRYAFVHPKPRPAKTRSASWGSHVALSGAPPRWNRNVLFPWRCSRRGRTLWVVQTAPQNATRPLEGENPTPVFPSVRASNFRCPCRRRPGHPQFQARPFTSFPYSRHESCGDNFRAGPPDALRAFTVAASLWQPARQETCHAGCWSLRHQEQQSFALFAFEAQRKRGPRKQSFAVLGPNARKRRVRIAQDARSRSG